MRVKMRSTIIPYLYWKFSVKCSVDKFNLGSGGLSWVQHESKHLQLCKLDQELSNLTLSLN